MKIQTTAMSGHQPAMAIGVYRAICALVEVASLFQSHAFPGGLHFGACRYYRSL